MNDISIRFDSINLIGREVVTCLLILNEFVLIGTSMGRALQIDHSEQSVICEDGITFLSSVMYIKKIDDFLWIRYKNSSASRSKDGGRTWDFLE